MEPVKQLTEEDDEMWWDGSMKDETQRTLLQWKVSSGKDTKRRGFTKPLTPRGRSTRSRHLAETFERVPKKTDQELTGPFSRGSLRRDDGIPWLDFWRGRRG
jgi:hypothetical protein